MDSTTQHDSVVLNDHPQLTRSLSESQPSASPITFLDDTHVSSWADFLTLYANGRWHPSRIPHIPNISKQETNPPEPETGSSASTLGAASQEFFTKGFFSAPHPPNEIERRRALYRFDILRSPSDPHFDRIVHLVKLVFSTKIALITLVDEEDQWFKSESGLGCSETPRTVSFCAHTILQPNSEPLIVPDCHQDWRFQHNPLVTGPPNIRFYAGAPLRTSEGLNVGSLCVIDDQPRSFTPRDRHTLKEFASIVMREMELRRDRLQLHLRDRIQNSMESFARDCLETGDDPNSPSQTDGEGMDAIYRHAASLITRTLKADGSIVMEASQFSHLHPSHVKKPTVAIALHEARSDGHFAASEVVLDDEQRTKMLCFFQRFSNGHLYEKLPQPFKGILPSTTDGAILVPVFYHDRTPFAIICAYLLRDPQRPRRLLEPFAMAYLRAIGVIILSAALKRQMKLSNQAKSLFISNITHELRTPLHGILAAAELLKDTLVGPQADPLQMAYLDAIRSCGTTLNETVNHVLDFQKLTSPRSPSSASLSSVVDLLALVDEALKACWMGSLTNVLTLQNLAHNKEPQITLSQSKQLELILDVEYRDGGWMAECEVAGIRRVLLNLLGNAIKFTTNGFVHLSLRVLESQGLEQYIELSVIDTGKGMTQEFQQNGLFRPFSQADHLQPGTGLGLAIVRSISDRLKGNIDIQSSTDRGTRVTFTFPVHFKDQASTLQETVSTFRRAKLVGFDPSSNGQSLLLSSICKYLNQWCSIEQTSDPSPDVVIANEGVGMDVEGLLRHPKDQPLLILCSAQPNSSLKEAIEVMKSSGGRCETVLKPVGPRQLLEGLMKLASPSTTSALKVQSVKDRTPTVDHSNVNVLVVEDNPMLRSVLTRWLRSQHYRYHEAEDGLEAVQIFSDKAAGYFHIILVDMSMPRLDGVDATAQIRAVEANRGSTHRSRIIALTGRSTQDDRNRAFQAGVDDYLVKPVPLKMLTQVFTSAGVI